MEVQAISRNIRISPRKVRIVANLIRGKKAGEAISILHNTPKAASKIIEKCLRSAMANAENNNNMNIDNLYISTIFVDAGPIMKSASTLPWTGFRDYETYQYTDGKSF